MKQYSKGTKFIVCGHDELLKKGWMHVPNGIFSDTYLHDDFPGCPINAVMIKDYEGQTLTTNEDCRRDDWYHVDEESFWIWPVATFLLIGTFVDDENEHTCEEGMTPIDCWFICKTCGTNLRQIKG